MPPFGNDAAVVAVAPADGDPLEFYRSVANSLVVGLLEARVNRLIWVSIASPLPDADGVAPVDAEDFPEVYRPFSLGHRAALERFTRSGLAWTAVSPAGDFDRTGVLCTDYALTEVDDPAAQITYADPPVLSSTLSNCPAHTFASMLAYCGRPWIPRHRLMAVQSLPSTGDASQRAAHGITQLERIVTDNGSCCRAHAFADAIGESRHQRTTTYTPRHNGKIERYNRILAEGFLYARTWRSERDRAAALQFRNQHYNYHRPQGVDDGKPPASATPSRVNNVLASYI